MKKTAAIIIFLIFTAPATAYVPKFWMIMSRTAENHGRGLYKVEQLVTFHHQQTPLTLHETWYVKDGENMRVTVTGENILSGMVNMTSVYQKGTRFFVGTDNKLMKISVGKDWFEPYFYFRYSKRIKPKMLSASMVPGEALSPQPKLRNVKEIKHEPENFVRLARVGGTVTWGIGEPTPAGATTYKPGLWIDQDRYLVRKLRLPSQTEVKAKNYQKHSGRFWLPADREVAWGDNTVNIKVLSVSRISNNKKNKALFSRNSLLSDKTKTSTVPLPDDKVIQEFYKKFR